MVLRRDSPPSQRRLRAKPPPIHCHAQSDREGSRTGGEGAWCCTSVRPRIVDGVGALETRRCGTSTFPSLYNSCLARTTAAIRYPLNPDGVTAVALRCIGHTRQWLHLIDPPPPRRFLAPLSFSHPRGKTICCSSRSRGRPLTCPILDTCSP